MKKLIIAAAALVAMTAGQALAVPAGKTVEFPTSMGTVTFKGDVHAAKGLKCKDCHPKIFKMKKGADVFKMADINAGKYCGECHNGTKAFKPAGNCMKCHKK
jgi:c(7)-type cytochrome triheme protein